MNKRLGSVIVFVGVVIVVILFTVSRMDFGSTSGNSDTDISDAQVVGEQARVVRVIDGDTIDVMLDGIEERVRYVGVNTPERDEPCYQDATNFNRELVNGKTVTLVQDTSDRDQYGRLLRYIYVGDVFVERELLVNGFAETVRYDPDTQYFNEFVALERQAAEDNLACHATGIFDDGSNTR